MPDNGNSPGHVPVMVPARAIEGRLFILGGSANHVTFPGDVRLEDGIYDIRVMAFLHDGRWTDSGSNQSRSLKSPPDEQVPGRNQGPKGLDLSDGEDHAERMESYENLLDEIANVICGSSGTKIMYNRIVELLQLFHGKLFP